MTLDLFGRARQMIRGIGPAEPPEPQPYEVTCPEGHRLRGWRTEGYQAVRCPSCGEGVFVLPRSPLPDPPAVAGRKGRRRVEAPAEPEPARWLDQEPIPLAEDGDEFAPEEAEIEWVEPGSSAEAEAEPPTPEPAEAPAPPRPRPAAPPETAAERRRPASGPAKPRRPSPERAPQRRQPAEAAAPEPEPEPEPTGPRVALPARPTVREWAWKRRHALMLLGILVLVFGTVGVRFARQRWQRLPMLAEAGRVEGLKALEAGKFDLAKQKLGAAASMLEELGDPSAPGVRQAADEAAVIADLVGLSLEDLLREAATGQEGAEGLDSRHKGRSILLDGHLVEVGGALTIDYEVLVPGPTRPRVGRIDLADLHLFDSGSFKPGDPVLLGARLDDLSLDGSGTWHFRLEPDSGVLMTNARALEQLGWPPREATQAPPEAPR